MTHLSTLILLILNYSYAKMLKKILNILINNYILENECVHTQLIISLRLKHKVDKYVRYVNIVNALLFAKISITYTF